MKDIIAKAKKGITICFDYLRKSNCYDMLKVNSKALYDALFYANAWGIICIEEYTTQVAKAKDIYDTKLKELSL